jgi:hypothetical protein
MKPYHVNVYFHGLDSVKCKYLTEWATQHHDLSHSPRILVNKADSLMLTLGGTTPIDGHPYRHHIRPRSAWCKELCTPPLSKEHRYRTVLSSSTFCKLMQLDYPAMKEKMTPIREELLRHFMCPAKLQQAIILQLV